MAPMVNPLTAEPEQWPLVVNCLGVKCGACGAVIQPKRRGAPLATDVTVLIATITTHKPECSAVQAREALEIRMKERPCT